MVTVMERSRWIQDMFGDGTVCTSDKLEQKEMTRITVGVEVKHVDSDVRSSAFKS